MSEMAPEAYVPDAVTRVARNLTAIEHLDDALTDQAVHKANDKLMPGGRAMVALGPAANLEAWQYRVDAALKAAYDSGTSAPEIDDEDEWEPPLQTLRYWSDSWRREHGYELDQNPTIASEANFIRWCLAWAWGNETHFDDFARDIHKARLRLEDILYAGNRAERTRVHCQEAACERKPRLIKVYQDAEDDDFHKCPGCKHTYNETDFKKALAKQLRSESAEKFVRLSDALGTLKAQGRPERTIRKWFEDCKVEGFCDVITHEVWVWWPDLWRLHLSAAVRNRQGAA